MGWHELGRAVVFGAWTAIAMMLGQMAGAGYVGWLTIGRACLRILQCSVIVLAVGVALAGAGDAHAEQAREAPPPPWHLPRFDGATDSREQPPPGELVRPAPPDGRALFDLAVGCFPTPSWWRPELALEARAAQRRDTGGTIGTAPAEGTSYAGIVARVPLYSASEIDRERERESARRATVAATVGKIVQKLADREVHRRELELWRSIEARSGRRVAAGVAETAEQINAIKSVSTAESALIADAADLTAARLVLVGMCKDRADVEAMLDGLGVPR